MSDNSRKRQRKEITPAYEELDHYVNSVKKFYLDQHITHFVLHNAIDRPEEEMMNVLETLIERAYSHIRRDKRDAQLFSMILNGDGLETPIVIPARTREQNNVEMIMNEVYNY